MKPIYQPKGAAKEYGDYALNIYTGCPHRCFYCYVPQVLHKDREIFHSDIRPRGNIVEETRKQLEREHITGKLIHLCFTCDPYPTGYDSTPTREIIKLLKEYGNHVQILTKGNGYRDFDLLDGEDWYGITVSAFGKKFEENEPNAISPPERLRLLDIAHKKGIKTWVSFEPAVHAEGVITVLHIYSRCFDKVKIGKLNYHRSEINWAEFGHRVEELCKEKGVDYYIKDSLRAEMEKK